MRQDEADPRRFKSQYDATNPVSCQLYTNLMIFLMIDNRHHAANLTKSVFFSVSPLVCIKPEQEDRFTIITLLIFIITILAIIVFITAFFSTV